MTKHSEFIVHQREPFNGGSPPALLREHYQTPYDRFFVRNHGPVPAVDERAFRLKIGGLVANALELSLDDLKTFPRHTVGATLQCAGNRREAMIAIAPIPGEVEWGDEAVSHAEWGGVLLSDVLERAGVQPEARHVAFQGLDHAEHAPDGFGGSVPVEALRSLPVLLADTMNGEPLPPEHGYPLRVIVPGYIGARSVKWLAAIRLQEQPSDNYYQQHAYRLFPQAATPETADWNAAPMLGELPVNSIIWQPVAGEPVRAGDVTVSGHAFVGGGRTIERVEVSTDGGETWTQARFTSEAAPYVWRWWEASVSLTSGEHEIMARAWDSASNTQPERVTSVWNFKGYMNNACPRVRVTVIG